MRKLEKKDLPRLIIVLLIATVILLITVRDGVSVYEIALGSAIIIYAIKAITLLKERSKDGR